MTMYSNQEKDSLVEILITNLLKAHQFPSTYDFLKDYISQFNLTDPGMDFVRAFPCNADAILDEWNKRERKCGWPSQKTIAHVMTLPVYVVPVGRRGSTLNDLQWRISLTMAEIHLVQAFNNTQTKIFVLMKLIAKNILQPVCKDITSYVVKMVMLWLAEKIPQKKFRKKHLLARLTDALKYLKIAVEKKFLPSYMIPKRNLFVKMLQGQNQRKILLKLNFLLENGSGMISDFFKNHHPRENEIFQVCKTMYAANLIDKIHTCQIALLTTHQLANYFSEMFFASTWWHIPTYNIMFHSGPFLFTYGRRSLTGPLSLELSRKFAESEKNEQATLKPEKKTLVTVKFLTVMADIAGLTFLALVLCAAIFFAVLLIRNGLFLQLIHVLAFVFDVIVSRCILQIPVSTAGYAASCGAVMSSMKQNSLHEWPT